MIFLDAAIVLGVVGIFVYGTIRLLTRPQHEPRPVTDAGRWRIAHHDVDGVTRVVLRKVSSSGAGVLDEHLVATVHVDDPEYDAKFLTAMAAARERQALFEAEEP